MTNRSRYEEGRTSGRRRHQLAQLRGELERIDRLAQIAVELLLVRGDDVRGEGGERDDASAREVAALAEAALQLVAVGVRHGDVGQDDVGTVAGGVDQRLR